ncbi:acyltransferase [Cupriavidus oxalaticus]|uniref:Acyltransferase n=1 Tax=Cupriavidus oxalaticus TaxID=96344 RepID=A0A4P7L366_9BURK|nr:hypothetical protein [Cupriavidus oxalaticus]QBY49680.1 hypothetical protein E0W60_00070 [Cupriavidus oxalaticus]
MKDPVALYESYCLLCKNNLSKPIWYEDGFLNRDRLAEGEVRGNLDRLSLFSSARTFAEKVNFHGEGALTLIVEFWARISNLNINVSAGDLTLFVGPYSGISNLVVQSFDRGGWICFGAGNTVNTGNILVQGDGAGVFFWHDCMFSTNFHVRASDSHGIFSYDTRTRINHDASIRVGDHSWVGRSVMISKGVWAEDDIVFGQGAVVSGKLSGSSIYAGVPARKVRENVTWERARIKHLDDLPSTYYYRPRQKAVNSFLLDDQPFHPHVTFAYRDIRNSSLISKKYPWISR